MIEIAMTILSAMISAAAMVTVAVINTRDKHQKKIQSERERRRREGERLSMEVTLTTSELTDVMAIAVSGGHINGNMEEARKKAKNAREEFEKYIREEYAGSVAKI